MKKTALFLSAALLGGTVVFIGNQYTNTASTNDLSYRLAQLENKNNTPQLQNVSALKTSAITGIDFTVAADATLDAVVHVKNKQISREPINIFEFFNGGRSKQSDRARVAGAGSGVIISADGHIVTNNHVIKGAAEIEVTLNDNRTYAAKVIGTDPKADIAVLKITAQEDLPIIPFGDSDAAKVGEWVLAVGNPFDLTSTVTAGIISAKARDINKGDRNAQSFIQTDAAINPGNSGGALVNVSGELVGINTAITSRTGSYVGYAFAVPSNHVRKIVEDILEYGSVQKGILGVAGASLNDRIAKELDIDVTEGFYINEVTPESGAFKANLKQGDIIRRIDNVAINKFADLSGYISTKRPNDIVNVMILRDGATKNIPVTIYAPVNYYIEQLGIQVKPASAADLKRNQTDKGVVITDLAPSIAHYKELLGLVIYQIDDEDVNTIEDVKRIMQNKSDYDRTSIVFNNRYGERNRFIFGD